MRTIFTTFKASHVLSITSVLLGISLLVAQAQDNVIYLPLVRKQMANIDLSLVPTDMYPAFLQLMEDKPATILPGQEFKAISFRQDGDWAIATIAVMDGRTNGIGMDDTGALTLLHKSHDGSWQAALENTPTFQQLLSATPNSLLSELAKQLLVSSTSVLAKTINAENLKFPWSKGQSWLLIQGWHDRYGTPGGEALDFAPNHDELYKRVLAVQTGYVRRECIGTYTVNLQIQHVDGTVSEYWHLDKTTILPTTLGTDVAQGQILGAAYDGTPEGQPGRAGFDFDGCGRSEGPHIHFIPPAKNITIDGWTVQGANEWSKGSQIQTVGSWFESSNVPLNPSELVLFDEPNYAGSGIASWRFLSPGIYNLTSFDNKASSIAVPIGWAVVVYEDYDRRGRSKTFSYSDPDLSNDCFNPYSSCSDVNNAISSIEIFYQGLTCQQSTARASANTSSTDVLADCSAPTPVPPPTPAPPPSSDGIAIVSVPSISVAPGQQFNPSVKIRVDSGQLLVARGDHLHAIPEDTINTFGAWPVQAVKHNINTGGEYTFDVANDGAFRMTAPNTPGAYVSRWQLRVGGNHIGPIIEIPITVGTVAPPPRPPGWRAQYWNGYYSDNPWGNGRCRSDEYTDSIPFTKAWGSGGPGGGCSGERFSVLYERRFTFTGGRYRFHCHRDGYCRIFIPELGINHAEEAGPFAGMDWGVDIPAGNWEVKIEYAHRRENGDARLEFWWQGPDSYLPPLDVNCAANPYEWCAAYRVAWNSPSDSYILRRLEGFGYLDHNWGGDSPGYGIYSDFSAEWVRLATFEAGLYRFHVTHNDGVRLAIDQQEVVNQSACCREETVDRWLTAGEHRITVNWFDSGGDALIKVWWEKITACYRLDAKVDPPGTGAIQTNPPPDCPVDASQYKADTMVTLQATANPGYRFWLWRDAVNDATNPAAIVLNWDKRITAHFLANPLPTPTAAATPTPKATPTLTLPGDLINSFEEGVTGLHINAAVDNSATNITSTTEHATVGVKAAQLEFNHTQAIHQRAAYQYSFYPGQNWRNYQTIQFDLWANQPATVALALGTGAAYTWFEAASPQLLVVGHNTIHFDLQAASWNGGGRNQVTLAELNDVRYLAFLIYPTGDAQDAFFLDNLRLYPSQSAPTPTFTTTATSTFLPTRTTAPTSAPTTIPTNTPLPTPTSTSASGGVELLARPWRLVGDNGAAELYQSIPANALQGKNRLRITYNLFGLSALGGDASAIIFEQNGWRYISLADYGENGKDGEQTVDLPLADFPALNPNAPVGTLHTRFWHSRAFAVEIYSIIAYSTEGSMLIASPTPTPTPTYTPAPTNMPATPMPDLIFADGFENGNLLAWSARAIGGGDLGTNPAAVLVGTQGMEAVINDNTAMYVGDTRPNGAARYRVRFYFDPNSITMTSGDSHYLFYGYQGTTPVVLRIEFRRLNSSYQLRAAALNDAPTTGAATWKTTSYVTISDAPHVIEVDWQATAAPGANNGSLTFWIDGMQRAILSGLDNDTRRIDIARLGPIGALDTGTRGSYFFDAFESRRRTYIGPVSGSILAAELITADETLTTTVDTVLATSTLRATKATTLTANVAGLGVAVAFPAITTSEALTAQIRITDTQSLPAGHTLLEDMLAIQTSALVTQPVTITIAYGAAATGTLTTSVSLQQWNASAKQWEALPIQINPATQTITVVINVPATVALWQLETETLPVESMEENAATEETSTLAEFSIYLPLVQE